MTKQSDESQIQQASDTAERGNPAGDVRKWLHQCGHGTLGTISSQKALEGFPLGSIVPFAVDASGRPVILIASIAAHTKNLKADNRASLFVHDPVAAGDPQASWRASVMGQFKQLVPTRSRKEGEALPDYAEEITDQEWSEIMARYTQRVPNAPSYLNMHGFSFWRMSDIETVRYIGGFGKICWLKGSKYLEAVQAQSHPQMEEGAMHHMNDDHVENMKEMCRGLFGLDPQSVRMVRLDIGGCILETSEPDGLHYCSFDQVVEDAGGYKTEIIKLLRTARVNTKQREATH